MDDLAETPSVHSERSGVPGAAERRRPTGRVPRLVLGGIAVAAMLAAIVVFGVSQLRPTVSELQSTSGAGAADFPWYETEAQLVDAADAIISGRVVSEREGLIEDVEYTVLTVQINAVASGDLQPGTELEVKSPESDLAPLEFGPGDEVILFVDLYPDVPASLLNPAQAGYRITNNGVEAGAGNPIVLSPELLEQLGVSAP